MRRDNDVSMSTIRRWTSTILIPSTIIVWLIWKATELSSSTSSFNVNVRRRRDDEFDWNEWWKTTQLETDVVFSECRHVYLDVGANVGIQLRKLFEPSEYPNSPMVKRFEESFGSDPTIRMNTVCAYAFEANPRRAQRLMDLETCYRSKGWKVKVYVPRAVSDVDGEIVTLYSGRENHKNEWGATVIDSRVGGRRDRVETLDFSKFVLNRVARRRFTLKSSSLPPKTFMKIDAEGSEFQILYSATMRGSLCFVDEIVAEIHWKNLRPRESRIGMRKMWEGWKDAVKEGAGCGRWDFTRRNLVVSSLDDETYADDERPLPC